MEEVPLFHGRVGIVTREMANPKPHAVFIRAREFIDYNTSMITDVDPLRGLLFYSRVFQEFAVSYERGSPVIRCFL